MKDHGVRIVDNRDMGDYCMACKEHPCECCPSCGATPEQACEEWCGLNLDIWPEKTAVLEIL